MAIYCSHCLHEGTVREALTVVQGDAACLWHYAWHCSTPTTSQREILEAIEPVLRNGPWADAFGDPRHA